MKMHNKNRVLKELKKNGWKNWKMNNRIWIANLEAEAKKLLKIKARRIIIMMKQSHIRQKR